MKYIHPVDKSLIYKDIIQVGSVFTDPGIPILQAQLQPEGWSVGWRWHASRQFDVSRLQQWLKSLDWRRAKLVVRASEGWFSSNSVDNSLQPWKPSEWRQDSRLELIFEQPQDLEVLRAGLESCLIKAEG